MNLGQGFFLLLVSAVTAYEELDYNLVESPLRLELLKIGLNGFERLNAIPVVPRPLGSQRPGSFRRPTTTPRPFRKRPTVAAVRPTTTTFKPLPVVRPQTRPPQVLPVVRPQTRPPQILQPVPTTPRPLPVTLQPQLPSGAPLGTPTETLNLGMFQSPIVVPEIPSNIPQPTPIEVVSQTTPTQDGGISQPLLPEPFETVAQPAVPGSASQPFDAQNQDVAPVQQISDISAPTFPQVPPNQSFQEPTLSPIVVPEAPSFQPEDNFQPVFSNPNLPDSTSIPQVPVTPGIDFQQIPSISGMPPLQTLEAPSQSQSEAQPPFEGPNLPPIPPPPPTAPSSQTNTGAGGGRPQQPLVFPVAPPPTSVTFRPPFRPRPPIEKPPSAQPPFDSGPHVAPKPPPVPATSSTSFGVNTAPPSDKPQRPLPPSRPILQNPLPPPKPPFQLTTTEKPYVIFNESSMTDEGNYNFDFLVSNSVYRKEQGFLKKSLVYPGHVIHVKTGAYSFTSPEGTFHRVDFVADEHGYRAFESTY